MGDWFVKPVTDVRQLGSPPPLPQQLPNKTNPGDWQEMTFPGRWHDGRAVAAWLVREVELPTCLHDRAALLKFDSVGFAVHAYVNGVDCGSAVSGYAPVEFDVRKAIRPGRNLVQLAVTTYSQYPQLHPTGIHVFQAGVVGQDMKAVSLWQRARLELPPTVYIADVFVRPHTAKKRLYSDVELVNTTDALAEFDVVLTVRPATGGNTVLRFSPERVFLRAGDRRIVTLEADWPDPRLWWPHDPYLYDLVAELRWPKGEEAFDRTTWRFGFRDIVIRGIDLLLNGKKLVMRGDSYTRYTGVHRSKDEARAILDRYQRQRHINSLRLHVDTMEQYVLEAADEAGLLLLIQAPIAAGGGSIRDREAWEILTDMYLRYVKLSRNHPSVAIWGVANEAGGMTPYNLTPGSPFLAEKIRRTQRLDPTR
ncbi:MAG: glycoside hydrolase family 2 TIM barrel-domain containing protein, partial [Candidatus Bilamarchaeaceae archaeon]